MGLRGKTVSILIATIVLASLAVVGGSRLYFGGSIARIERKEAEEALARAASLVEDDLDQLDLTVRDWAYWDDTWNYVVSRYPAYAEANLSAESFESLQLSSLVLLDARGDTVYAKARDAAIIDLVTERFRGKRLSAGEGGRGLLLAGDALELYDARPILRNDASGPPRGILVMTRDLNAARLARYSRLSGLDVRVTPLPAGAAPGASVFVGAASIVASGPIAETSGPSVAQIRISVSKADDRYSSRYLTLFLVGVALLVAVFGMLAVLAFEFAVLGRMRAIGVELLRIAGENKVGAFLTVSGRDELTDLETTMNATLASFYASMSERNAAIREIHHRVKNNLQLIASLISLQIGETGSAETAGALRDIGRRVLAMAFVHEELDIDHEIESVDAARLFERISIATRQSVGDGAAVDVAIECEGVGIGLEQAIPVGLIAGEVLNNCYRHAFPEGRAGSIRIELRALEGGGYALAIRDDGVGFAEEGKGRLGMDIIKALAQQLRADYSYRTEARGGTLFSLRMRIAPRRPSLYTCGL